MKMTTEEAFVKTLQMHGIEHAFGIIGSAMMPISDIFGDAGITFWDCAHEGSGGMMADGYTRVTGKMDTGMARDLLFDVLQATEDDTDAIIARAEALGDDARGAELRGIWEGFARDLGLPAIDARDGAEVIRAAADAGASMINDVSALRSPGAIDVASTLEVPVCLMHMQGEPRTMQQAPQYDDVVADILKYLGDRMAACVQAGIPRERLVVDPGFGFGKTLSHNLALLRELERFSSLGVPVLAGLSRKSMLGTITGRPVEERMVASVAAALIAVERGARIVRVHDVAGTVDAIKVWQAVNNEAGATGAAG